MKSQWSESVNATDQFQLSYFCIYNPSLAPDEDSPKEQILYYTSQKTNVSWDTKMRQIGLAQGLVSFTRIFQSTAENIYSQNHHLMIFEPEPNFWMHACIDLNSKRRNESKDKERKRDREEKRDRDRDNLDTELSRSVRYILERLYYQFRFLHGTFNSNFDNGRQVLCDLLETFFNQRIWKCSFSNDSLLQVFQPVERYNLIDSDSAAIIYTFLHKLEERFFRIDQSFLWYLGKLVSCTKGDLCKDDMLSLRDLVYGCPISQNSNNQDDKKNEFENSQPKSTMSGFLELFSRTISVSSLTKGEEKEVISKPTSSLSIQGNYLQSKEDTTYHPIPIHLERESSIDTTLQSLIIYEYGTIRITLLVRMDSTNEDDLSLDELHEMLSLYLPDILSRLLTIKISGNGNSSKQKTLATVTAMAIAKKNMNISNGNDITNDISTVNGYVFHDTDSGIGQIKNCDISDVLYYQDLESDIKSQKWSVNQVITRATGTSHWYSTKKEGTRTIFTTHKQTETSLSDVDIDQSHLFHECRI